MIKKLIFIFYFGVTILISCTVNHKAGKNPETSCVSFDLDSIRKRGKLIAVTGFNSTDYFIYRGEPMGFNYELLKSFSDHIGIDIEIVADNSPEHASSMLMKGDADIVAMGLNSASSASKDIKFTDPVDETKFVLVQRKPGISGTSGKYNHSGTFITSTSDLAGKKVYVQRGSAAIERLQTLQKEIGDSISILEVPYEPEQLIRHVADGEIDYMVCDEHIAVINASDYSHIDVSTPVSIRQDVAWGVRNIGSDNLMREFNRWIAAYRRTGSYKTLYSKYFMNLHSGRMVNSDYYAINTGKVSQYDDMIRKYSALIDWDWRLLASLIFQESRFQADVISVAGAYGLMQIMPVTGRNFGIDIKLSPENNMKAGISYINWLHSIFDPKIIDKDERLRFILAAYNAGPGHVLDAMKLAEKNGMDPHKWDGSVAVWLMKKSDPKYYNDSVVKNGYYPGRESVAYVSKVLDRYEHYKNIIPSVERK